MPVTAADIVASWKVAEALLREGHVEAAICTLHGLILSAGVKANNNNAVGATTTTTASFPVALFIPETLTRLRLAHIFCYMTANPDAARRLLEELLPRFEGFTAPPVPLFSAAAQALLLVNQQQTTTKQQQLAAVAHEMFVRKFPFAIHVLKCHTFRLLGEAWLRKAAASSSSSSNSSSSNNATASATATQNVHAALCLLRDAASIVDSVLVRTKEWLGVSDSNGAEVSRRRQRAGDEPSNNNNSDENEQEKQLVQHVWAVAALRLASLRLSIRGLEASALHSLAVTATGSNSSSGDSSSVNLARDLVAKTTSALNEFFVTVGADNNNNNSNTSEEILRRLFEHFDKHQQNTTSDDDNAASAIMTMNSKIAPQSLLTPSLAAIALHHIVGMLLLAAATGSTTMHERAAQILESWSRAEQQQANSNDSSNNSSNKDDGFARFSQLYRFLFLLSNPDRATQQDLQQFLSSGVGNSNGAGKFDIKDDFEMPRPVAGVKTRRQLQQQQQQQQKTTSATAQDRNHNDAADDAHERNIADVATWLRDSIVESGTVRCGAKLVTLLHTIQRYSASTSSSGDNAAEQFCRSDECLDQLNNMMFVVEDQLRKLTSNTTTTNSNTATSASTNNSAAVVVGPRQHAEVKFLVAVKVSAYCELALFDLMQQDICSALTKLDSLRQYVVLFRKHTLCFRGNLHLLIALVALYLGHADAVSMHCAVAQEIYIAERGDDDDGHEENDDGNHSRNNNSNNAEKEDPALGGPFLVEAAACYSLLKSTAPNSPASSATTRRRLRQRFDQLTDAAASAIHELQQQQQQKNKDANNTATTTTTTTTPSLLMWQLLLAARSLEDRDAPRALEILRPVIDADAASRSRSSSQPQHQSISAPTTTSPAGISVPRQYILATALRLSGAAHSMLGDVAACNTSISASCRADAVIEDENCAIHCITFALQTLVIANERDQHKQRELFNQAQKQSEQFGAQVKLIMSGQLASTVEGLLAFAPGCAEYNRWISGVGGGAGSPSASVPRARGSTLIK